MNSHGGYYKGDIQFNLDDYRAYIHNNGVVVQGSGGGENFRLVGARITVHAGAGNDIITIPGSKNNLVYGDAGNDWIGIGANYGGSRNNTVYGGAGKDTIRIKSTRVYADGGDGDDFFIPMSSTDECENVSIFGGKGNDTLWFIDNTTVTATGGAGSDVYFFDRDVSDPNPEHNEVVITDLSSEDIIAYYDDNYDTDGTELAYRMEGGNVVLYDQTYNLFNITLQGVHSLREVANVRYESNDESTTLGELFDVTTEPVSLNSAGTYATLMSDYEESEFYADDYDDGIKTIDASAVQRSLEITGNDAANKIIGSSKVDTIFGEGGKDSLFGGAGNDKLFGGDGNDTLVGGAGNDILTGDDGKDVFVYASGDGNDTITDYSSGDKIKITKGTVSKYSVSGTNGVLKIGSGKITLKNVGSNAVTVVDKNNKTLTYKYVAGVNLNKAAASDATSATITSGFKSSKFSATEYSKLVTVTAANFGKAVTLTGNNLNNKLIGGKKNDALYGGNGNDTIYGGAGNDKIFGEAGNDSLFGDAGNDTLIGDKGNDTLTGGKGNDIFQYASGDGKDVITDYAAGDKIKITKGTISKYSVSGKDGILKIGSGQITLKNIGDSAVSVVGADNKTTVYKNVTGVNLNNTAASKSTSVTITSGFKASKFSATEYSALVTVTAANFGKAVTLTGNNLNNKLIGGAKADTLIGGKGNDTLTGGKGNDIFQYASGDGKDVITDYAAGDKIKITKGTISKTTVKNNDVIFTVGSGNITVKNGKGKKISVVNANGKTTTKTYSKTMSSYDLIADNNYSTSQLDSILQVQSLGDIDFSDNKTLNDSLQSILAYSEK